MKEDEIHRVWHGIDAEFVAGAFDGRDLDSPEPSVNRHPAYRHAWEVARAEKTGHPIPARLSRARAGHIESGGDFYSFAKEIEG